MNTICLTGLDGTNPLAFFAALGVLVALDEAHHREATGERPRLSWHFDGVWRPSIRSGYPDLGSMVGALDADRVEAGKDPALAVADDVKLQPTELRAALDAWLHLTTPMNRRTVDWFTAFVSQGALDNNGASKPSSLHFTAGQQKFLKAATDLARGATAADILKALCGPWTYDSKLPVMGWDNTETRDYALRASDPSREKLGNPGADWLALRGLVLFPTAAVRQRQQTAGVRGGWKTSTLVWPLWNRAGTVDEVKGLVLLRDLTTQSAHARARRGVAHVCEVQILRSDQGGYGSVTPAQSR